MAEAELVIVFEVRRPEPEPTGDEVRVHRTAIVQPGAVVGPGTVIGPYASVGAHVVLGRGCRIGASAVVDGLTTIGDHTEIFPFASIGLAPQDLKFKGEPTRLVIGAHNVFREFVTIHRGTAGGGGVTAIGDHNLFMAYAHVAHDCHVGNWTIFGNGATMGGHVTVEDYATISAYSGVHQFCRVGQHAFIGGYTVVTRDALPFAKTVGNRRADLRCQHDRSGAPRVQARADFQAAPGVPAPGPAQHEPRPRADRARHLAGGPEVSYLVNFIRSARRGVILRRPSKRVDETLDVE